MTQAQAKSQLGLHLECGSECFSLASGL
jgi:hypothetical protein